MLNAQAQAPGFMLPKASEPNARAGEQSSQTI